MSLTALQRSQGAFVAALAADALGSQFEFCPQADLLRKPLHELTTLVDCGPWHTLAGQPTEDGELMLLVARMLVFQGSYAVQGALEAYQYWLGTDPFAINANTQQAFSSGPLPQDFSANALVRQIPLALQAGRVSNSQLVSWAMADTALSQTAVLLQQLAALYVSLLAVAITRGVTGIELYEEVGQLARQLRVDPLIFQTIEQALFVPATAEQLQTCPVLAAFQNLLFQLQYAKSLRHAVADTIRLGGDTGTNAVLVAAVFGAMEGLDAVPEDWCQALENCRAQEGVTGVEQPRPETFWPVDAAQLAQQLNRLA